MSDTENITTRTMHDIQVSVEFPAVCPFCNSKKVSNGAISVTYMCETELLLVYEHRNITVLETNKDVRTIQSTECKLQAMSDRIDRLISKLNIRFNEVEEMAVDNETAIALINKKLLDK